MAALDILVGGSPSSGTTLLSIMLDSHPEILCGPEIGLLCHPGFWRGNLSDRCPGIRLLYDHLDWYSTTEKRVRSMLHLGPHELLDRLYGPVREARGKRLCAEKSPPNIYAMPAYLEAVPDGRCVVMMRDGRDVVCSLMRRGYSFRQAIERWEWSAAHARRALEDPRAQLIMYEDLATAPRETLSKLLDFLGLEDGLDAMLERRSDRTDAMCSWTRRPSDPINGDAIGRWRSELTRAQARAVNLYR